MTVQVRKGFLGNTVYYCEHSKDQKSVCDTCTALDIKEKQAERDLYQTNLSRLASFDADVTATHESEA